MNLLKNILSVIAFIYLCYHIYTYGPGAFNVTVMVIFILSVAANYFKSRRSRDLQANEESRRKRSTRKRKNNKENS